MTIAAIVGLFIKYLPDLLKAAQKTPEIMQFITKLRNHLKQTKEWTADEEAEFKARKKAITSQAHWKPENSTSKITAKKKEK